MGFLFWKPFFYLIIMKTIMSEADFKQLKKYIQTAKHIHARDVFLLSKKLQNATISKTISHTVVTINSTVNILFLDTNQQKQFTIVYPHLVSLQDQKISMFSPIASSIIGSSVGDIIECKLPAGNKKIEILHVQQPELATKI